MQTAYDILRTVPGNSPAAIAGRCARAVRRANAWKVAAGRLTQADLRRWARRIEREAKAHPGDFAHWAGVLRDPGRLA